ncbi:MAG: AMP-binding protein [Microbacterium sp.]|uniref:AMP-binding protein n=1 Tax=Microbacterium sp. TaxID=51671 RepID=UPI002724FCE6|nr:AMP-binding protein [Microbacterium sp.]MDO8383860.1 AMP-binding protein [Microbacterium sp.]
MRSPFPDVEIPETSVFAYLFGEMSDEDRLRPALIDGTSGDVTTYGELVEQVEAVAGALASRGISPGDVVALHSPNSPAFAVVFHGILRAGGVATTVNPLSTPVEIESQLQDSGAALLFTVSALLPAALQATQAAGIAQRQIFAIDEAPGFEALADLVAEKHPAPSVSFDPATHLAVLPYSSGTTGHPKGVMLTHRNLVANVAQAGPMVGVGSDDVVLAVLPFSHIYGMTVLLDLALKERASLVTMPRFDLAEFLRIIQDHRTTFVFIAPPIAVALAKHPAVDDYDLTSVRVIMSGAAPLDELVGNAVAKRLDARMMQGFGMTEMSPVSHVIPIDRIDIPVGTIGLIVPNMEVRLVDPASGQEIEQPADGVSAPGELLCKGPNVMLGYLGNEQATAAAFTDDGFLRTGDLATVSAEGYFTIVDRLKELIKYKGHQVAPAELEALLLSHPSIADAAVIGTKDDEGEEVPKAFVVLQPGAELASDEVIAFIADRVAPYKKVRQVEMIASIPKSSSGKILRKDLRAREVDV